MELVEPTLTTVSAGPDGVLRGVGGRAGQADEAAARRTLRAQIAKLERELSEAFVTAFPDRLMPEAATAGHTPRLLSLGELEETRDSLAGRLHRLRSAIAKRAEVHEANRVALERILLDPAEHRFEVMPLRDLGEPGCGAYQVRPRLGLIGMLRGWWQVKLSSGCPLAGGHGLRP
ncbi:MAG TPA: hypothetical protein VG405_03280 [Solirubrobacteraceae bacterium]|jgi:hypothetical protein|nr:hypothetical protein [Solirubrobacteraceae bacterium]